MRSLKYIVLVLFATVAYAQQPADTLNWSHTTT
jgi:hypothetical protein